MTKDNTPLVALFWFNCKCGQRVNRGDTYTIQDDVAMCLKCAYPEPEKRNLALVRTYLKKAI